LATAISSQDLTKRYGSTVALDSLSLNVEESVIYGFLGPNGAGKTTTLKILAGLSRPTSGVAWVAGEKAVPDSIALRNKIGYLPEEPVFYNWMTGEEYLVLMGEMFHLPSKENKTRRQELLELVDLKGAAQRRIGGYSRGMRQRLGIAQALMNRPSVLFLDEPSSALDPMGRVEVLDTLLRLKAQATTIFLSSHVLADVERICDMVGIVDKGRLIVEAGVAELRQRFAHSLLEVEFEETASSFIAMLERLPWVQKVEVADGSNAAKFTVRARDVSVAKRELPRLVAESGLTLRQYQLVLPTLEDVFIELVGKKEG
jgi:ABC-2 type transport system ATP-binding protein